MRHVWTDEAKYAAWRRVEIAVCEAYARRGRVPVDAVTRIRECRIDVHRLREIERQVHHDVVAFLVMLEEQLGSDARFVHMGLTSSDVVDTALALQLRSAADLLIGGQERLLERLHKCAHLEWSAQALLNLQRLRQAKAFVAVGKLSGAVGTSAHIEIGIEEEVCDDLGLGVEAVSNQVVQRDRHADFCMTLALVAASTTAFVLIAREDDRLGLFAERHQNDTLSHDVSVDAAVGEVVGLARVTRANAHAAVQNVALWHERDITHSSVERIILPDCTIALDRILSLAWGLLEPDFVM